MYFIDFTMYYDYSRLVGMEYCDKVLGSWYPSLPSHDGDDLKRHGVCLSLFFHTERDGAGILQGCVDMWGFEMPFAVKNRPADKVVN